MIRQTNIPQICAPGEGISADFFQSIRQYDAGDGGVAVKGVFLNNRQPCGQHKGVCAGGSSHTENSQQTNKQKNR